MKILLLSDNPFTNTGYSSQSLFLMNKLADAGHEVHYMAHNYTGQVLPVGSVKLADGTPFKFTLYPNGREPYCKDLIVHRIREIKPDYFIILLDTFMLYPWLIDLDMAPAKTIFWYPSDGGRFPQGCEAILRKVNIPVCMSKFGSKQVLDYFGIECEQIPHAVDHKIFKPIKGKKRDELRAKWGLTGKFVVGLMGRNQGRKMHDRAFKMFAKLAEKVPEAILLCHFDSSDAAAVFDINVLVKHYNLHNRVVFTGTKYFQGFTYLEMCDVYNLMDVYLSSTSGEGFGVGTIEAMSCEVPVVITDYTSSRELVFENEAGLLINLVGTSGEDLFKYKSPEYDSLVGNGCITGSWGVERGLACVEDGFRKLFYLYGNSALLKKYGANGRKAVLKNFTWEVVSKSWLGLLEKYDG